MRMMIDEKGGANYAEIYPEPLENGQILKEYSISFSRILSRKRSRYVLFSDGGVMFLVILNVIRALRVHNRQDCCIISIDNSRS